MNVKHYEAHVCVSIREMIAGVCEEGEERRK